MAVPTRVVWFHPRRESGLSLYSMQFNYLGNVLEEGIPPTDLLVSNWQAKAMEVVETDEGTGNNDGTAVYLITPNQEVQDGLQQFWLLIGEVASALPSDDVVGSAIVDLSGGIPITLSGVTAILADIQDAVSQITGECNTENIEDAVTGILEDTEEILEEIGDIAGVIQSQESIINVLTPTQISLYRGTTLTIPRINLGLLSSYDKIYFTVKRSKIDEDEDCIFQIVWIRAGGGGLLRINGAEAETSSHGSITMDDEVAGNLTVVLAAVESAKIEETDFLFDIKGIDSATPNVVDMLQEGFFSLTAPVTLAVE